MILVVLLACTALSAEADSVDERVWSAYENCSTGWANVSWVCDPSSQLNNETTEKLETLLLRIHTQTPCFCADSDLCFRYKDVPIKSGFVAALLVVEQFSSSNSSVLETTAIDIYAEKQLANGGCDNGILIIYAVSNVSFLTYRGSLSYITLSQAEEEQIQNRTQHLLTSRRDNGALLVMVSQYKIKLRGKTRFIDSFWETWIGMIVGSVIVGAVLAILTAICCSRIWGKTKSEKRFAREKKAEESFYASLYRSEDPIYVISEPESIYNSTERIIRNSTPGNSTGRRQFPNLDNNYTHEIQKTECFVSEQ